MRLNKNYISSYQRKHIDRPMSLLNPRLRRGGRYEYFYFDMEQIVQHFYPVFTALIVRIFVNVVTGWVLCTARKTVTRILSPTDPKNLHAYDAYRRIFPDAIWQSRLVKGCGNNMSIARLAYNIALNYITD